MGSRSINKMGRIPLRAAMLAGVTALALAAASGTAKADLIFSGSGTNNAGTPISATVNFSLTGNLFQIVLTNTGETKEQAGVLTNLAVTTAPQPAIALPSPDGTIAVTSGSSRVSGTTVDTTTPLGEEWAYLSGGLASSGFGVGTGQGNLCGSTTCTGQALQGSAFGLVGSGTTSADLQLNGLKPANTYIKDSVTVDITLPSTSNFTLSDITNVIFQYGTSSGEGSITVDGCTAGSDCHTTVPEPGSLALLGTGLLGLGLAARRKRRRA